MEKQEVKEINRVYTRFRGGEVATDSYAIQVVLHHLPEGLLRCSISAVDQEVCWNCEHTGKIPLDQYCSQYILGHAELNWIYGGVLKILKEMKEYLLDANCLILKPEQIYLEPGEEKLWCCFVPFYVKNVWKSLQELSQYVLGHLDKQDTEAVRIAYGMYQYFSQDGHNLEDAWAILCENVSNSDIDKSADLRMENETDLAVEDSLKEEIIEEVVEEVKFPYIGWIIMGLSGTSAVFLLTYVALNEWYLSNAKKILFLILIAVFTAVALFVWKKWGFRMKKNNPMK